MPVDRGMSSELALQFNWLNLDSNALMCVESVGLQRKNSHETILPCEHTYFLLYLSRIAGVIVWAV